MFKKLKHYFIKKKINKNLTNRDFSEINASVTTLAFLVDETVFQDFEAFYSYSSLLGIQRKDVMIYSFVKHNNKLPSLRQDQVCDKDFSLGAVVKNQNAIDFLSKSFDALIGYYDEKNDFLNLMVSQSNAKFKIGGIRADKRLFDLLIAVELDDMETFKSETKKYLTVLNKLP